MGGIAHTKSGKQEGSPAFQMIYGALWMVGIAVLAITGWWWPGIMVVVALTSIAQAIYSVRSRQQPPAVNIPPVSVDIPPVSVEIPPVRVAGAAQPARAAKMPAQCKACGAALGHDLVVWRGAGAAACAYCNTPVPLEFGAPEPAR